MPHPFVRSRQTSSWLFGSLLGAFSVGASGCFGDGDWGFEPRSPSDSSHVKVVFDPDLDFSRYQTFAFKEDVDNEMLEGLESDARRDLDLINERMALELGDLGLTEVSAEDADLLAFSLARTDSETGVTWTCVGGVWGGYWSWDWGYYYDPCAWLEPVYFEVDRTTLMIGLLDAELSEVIFAGFIDGLTSDPQIRSRQIARAVDRIFARYPARPAPSGMDAGTDAGARDPDAGSPNEDAGAAGLDAGLNADAATNVDAGPDADAGAF